MWEALHAIQNAILGIGTDQERVLSRLDMLEHRISTRIFLMEKRLMAKIDDLTAILTVVEADVAAVVTALANAGTPVDLDPAIAKLTAISGTLKTALGVGDLPPPGAA
jgi:hypothetical protein